MFGLSILPSLLFAQADAGSFRPFWHELERRSGPELAGIAVPSTDPGVFYATQPIRPAHPFRELIASWNVDCPSESGFAVELRVRGSCGESPWKVLGSWGRLAPTAKSIGFEHGSVDIDWFHSATDTFDTAELRFVRAPQSASPTVAGLALCFSDPERPSAVTTNESEAARPAPLTVPFHSQKSEDASIAARICSPTSVAMVLGYHGVELGVRDVAARCFDAEHDIYGNWPRNVQAAYSFGVSGYIDRFTSWSAVLDSLRQKIPLVCSISVKEGELPGAPYSKTAGHLIVLVGFDEQGNCLVNDPAASDPKEVRRTYSRTQMETVWMKKGGVAYVLSPPSKER